MRRSLLIGEETGEPRRAGVAAIGLPGEAPSIGEKLEIAPSTKLKVSSKYLNILALPRGLEPLFSP